MKDDPAEQRTKINRKHAIPESPPLVGAKVTGVGALGWFSSGMELERGFSVAAVDFVALLLCGAAVDFLAVVCVDGTWPELSKQSTL